MKKLQAVSGVAVVALTTGLTNTTYATTDQTETLASVVKSPDKASVTKKEVDEIRLDLEKSAEAVRNQTSVVENARSDEEKALENVANLETAEIAALSLVDQATPEVLANLESNIAAEEEHLLQADTTVSAAQNELTKAKEELTAQAEVLKEANTNLEASEKRVSEAEANVTEAENYFDPAYKEQIESNLAAKQASLEESKEALSVAEQGISIAKESDVKTDSEISALEAQLQDAKETLESDKIAVDKANDELSKTQVQSEQLLKDISILKAEIAKIEQTMKVDKSAAIKELEQALDVLANAQSELRSAEQALAVLEQSERQRQQAISDAKARLRNVQSDYDAALANLDRLTREYEESKPTSNVYGLTNYTQTHPSRTNRVFGVATFGATGCVPTALAIIFTELLGRTIEPLEVGAWLYNNTDEFNTRGEGTSGIGVLKATRHYGLKPEVLTSYDAIVKALKEGHLIAAAVQNNKFSPWGPSYSHEIVLTGYSNGNTYVYDPYTTANAGWYSVASLWREQSRAEGDVYGLGAPFVKISSYKTERVAAERNSALSRVQRLSDSKRTLGEELSQLLAQSNQLNHAQSRVTHFRNAVTEAEKKVVSSRDLVNSLATSHSELSGLLSQKQSLLAQKETARAAVANQLVSVKSQKDNADVTYSRAKSKYDALNQRLTSVKSLPRQLELAQSRLAEANRQFEQAEKAYQVAQATMVTFKENLSTKEAYLTKAKENLMLKKSEYTVTKDKLKDELSKYMLLKAALEKATLNLDSKLASQSNLSQKVSQFKKQLVSLKESGNELFKARESLLEAQKDLESKKQILLKELAKLDELKAENEELSKQHATVLAAYTAYLATQKEVVELTQAADSPKTEVQPLGAVKTSATSLAVTPTKVSTMSRSEKLLPKTGDRSALVSVMFGGLSVLLGLSTLKRKEN